MAKLEYRLLDKDLGYSVLYYYASIDRTEVATRFACDYYVKEGMTYLKSSCAVEAGTYIIYVKKVEEPNDSLSLTATKRTVGTLKLELRQYVANSAYYPEITAFELKDNLEVLLHLQSDFLYWLDQEWQRTSTEVDEDRKVYVYYATAIV